MKKVAVGGKTIKSRVIRYNFITVCLVAVIASVCSYLTSTRKTVEIAGNSLESHVGDISYRCENAYEELLNLVLICSSRGAFDLDELQRLPSSSYGRQGLDDVNTLGTFCALTGYGEYISRLSLFNDKGILLQRGTAFGSQDDRERILNAGWFEREAGKSMDAYELELVPSPFYRDDGSLLFPIAAEMDQGNGWVLLCVSPRLFEDILKETSNGQEVVLMTASGQRIASIHEDESHREDNDRVISRLISGEALSGRKQVRVHGRESLISWKRYARSGIMVYSSIPLDSLRNDRLMLFQTFLILFLGCLVIGLILSVLFTNQLNKPLERLVAHLQKVAGGDFSQDKSIETDGEVGMIGRVVNEMSGQIDKLMTQQMEDQREKSSLELKMLQAQINPHFLYNTLDSIKWIAVIQKNTGIVKVVTALSGLLRNMAKGFNEQVSVGRELDFLNDYVTIEKVRHAELFDLEIRVDDPALYEAQVIKLTLQPLVENAIFSGIEPGGKHGTIWIHICAEEEDLYMSVRDDGVGIPEEKLRTILEDTERVKGDHMSSIGLANVQRRIQLTYGEDYGLTVDSVEGSYTEIVVHIPLRIEKEGGEAGCTG